MTETKRAAPHPEWVKMYRKGVTTPKIAAAAGVGESTVRCLGAGRNLGLIATLGGLVDARRGQESRVGRINLWHASPAVIPSA